MDSVTELVDPALLRAQTRVGTVLREKWRLDAVLGVGGMASVFAATHRNQSRAAIKILHPELSAHPEVRSRFLREGPAANVVAHPGVVRVLDEVPPVRFPIWLVSHRELRTSRRIRVVFEALAQGLA